MTSPSSERIRRRSRIRQEASHAHLITDISHLPTRTGRIAPLEALFVPSVRRAHHLRRVVQLAADTGVMLVVLSSRLSLVADVSALIASVPGARGLAIQIPDDYHHDYFKHRTSSDPAFKIASAHRTSDLSMKRNIALLLARLLGWSKIMFLDDDIFGVTANHLAKVAAQLDDAQVTGLISRRFPDNSVVCHANRLSGADQGIFLTGAALGVNCDDLPPPFFPDVYNEDWFGFHEHAAKFRMSSVGNARQRAFNPFLDPQRAAHEEFGDLLAEGLYARAGHDDDVAHRSAPGLGDKDYWERFADARRLLLKTIGDRLKRGVETHESVQAQESLRLASAQAERISSDDCLAFLEAWQQDSTEFARVAAGLPAGGGYANALDTLELPNWQQVEFGHLSVRRS